MAENNNIIISPTVSKNHLDSLDSNSLDHQEPVLTDYESKKLDRIYFRLDCRIIPALWCLYFLSSFGSSAYGNTLTMNYKDGHSLEQSLGLNPHQLSVASALYYVSFIIFDLPMNLAMTRLPPQIWLARIIISVGLVYCCYTALSTPGGLIAIRFISGLCGAGVWPGMAFYISLWYPSHRSAKRIGYYFTAAQISAAVAGLVSAGFQKIDGNRGYYGWQWLFLTYGLITIAVGISLVWWLPDRPNTSENIGQISVNRFEAKLHNLFPKNPYPLNEVDADIHMKDVESHTKRKFDWNAKDLLAVMKDVRIWPLIMMYFGVVGTGFGLAVFGTTIIKTNNPSLSDIDVSLLYAPIWLFDLGGILTLTPFADRYKKYRGLVFSFACCIIICGLCVTTYAKGDWSRYGGLLIAGYGLGPTVPICMAWSAEIFQPRHGDVGTAAASALVSGLGNLGSVMATYALYSGWPADKERMYRDSNMILVLITGISMIASFSCYALRKFLGDFDK
ncbi:hypothetical protein DASC09_023020 [Saccharomycopsis crataegensis]|uniref:Major facilitator superfamily (MFS) profile domain-containing protein n=1 Tax=Saccharomycopsis crataegensis TaxID=43959 RepID=A0AAV5QJK1_9ASCO|nr:hypothetical protein DASC09_023020 [Saccharomycopsis crataegensis]